MSRRGRVYLPFPYEDVVTFRADWSDFTENPSVYRPKIKKWKALSYLMSHLQFLSYCWSDITHPQIQFVYVGKYSPHFDVLSKMFPWAQYHLYFNTEMFKNGAVIDPRLYENSKLTIYEENFEQDISKWEKAALNEKNVYLVMNYIDEDETDSKKGNFNTRSR